MNIKLSSTHIRTVLEGSIFLAVAAVIVAWGIESSRFPDFGLQGSLFFLFTFFFVSFVLLYGVLVVLFQQIIGPDPKRARYRRISLSFVCVALIGVLTSLLGKRYVDSNYVSLLYLASIFVLFLRILVGPDSVRPATLLFRSPLKDWTATVLVAFGAVWIVETSQIAFTTSRLEPRCLPHLFIWNVLIVTTLVGLLLSLTKRIAFSITVVCVFYFTLAACSIVKLRILNSPFYPQDLQYLNELGPQLPRIFGLPTLTAFVVALILLLWWILRLFRGRKVLLSTFQRLVIGGVSLTLLISTALAFRYDTGRILLERVGVRVRGPDHDFSAARNGLLLETWLALHALYPKRPVGYSEAQIGRITDIYQPTNQSGREESERVNLVVYFVESLIDPTSLGVEFTSDPIPTIRKLMKSHSSGYAVASLFGRGSASSEFEILTGMTTFFLPRGSCPYKEYLRHNVPSLPRFLRQQGYRCTSFHVDPSHWFRRNHVYKHLGLDNFTTLRDDPTVPRDVTGLRPSDQALVDAIISSSQQGAPFFIFAFTDSTHYPYNHPHYLDSDLDVVSPLSAASRKELKTYINALRTADLAIAELIRHFEKYPRKTVVAIFGDHMPPFTYIYDETGYFDGANATVIDKVRRRYRVPGLIWTNFETKKQDFEYSFNFLPTRILSEMGFIPTGFLGTNEAFRTHYNVLSNYIMTAEGKRVLRDDLTEVDANVILDYELLQYDILFGKRYALRNFGFLSEEP